MDVWKERTIVWVSYKKHGVRALVPREIKEANHLRKKDWLKGRRERHICTPKSSTHALCTLHHLL